MSDTEFPPGWVAATLGEVADWGSGGTPKSGVSRYYGGDIPWVVSGDLNDGVVKLTSSTLTLDGLQESSAKWIPEGAVMIAMYGATIGKLGIAGQALTTNQAVASAIPKPGLVTARYLFWYLRSQRDAFRRAGKGGAQPNISQTILKSWPISLPPIEEQQRIADSIEGSVSRLDNALGQLTLARSRSSRLSERILAELLSGVTLRPLSELISSPLINGRSVPTEDGGFPVLRLTALKSNELNLAEHKEGRWSAEDAAPFLVSRGDFLVSRGNGSKRLVGRGALLTRRPFPVAFPDTMIRIRVNPEVILPEFIQAVWNSQIIRRHIEGNARTTAGIYKINQKILGATPVPVASIARQREILALLDVQLPPLVRAQQMASRVQSRAEHLRAALLRTAFVGGLVDRDPKAQPVQFFLEQIRAEQADGARRAGKGGARSGRAPLAAMAVEPPGQDVPTSLPPNEVIQQEFEIS
ncbi:restriction endonuclease subunit S [Streptomyces sp. NPDC059567]|uniref:restriction endonuclease subunit S n=1 Tax=Streptomyces sp. NPDC059567 TaxID=3346867 RepID=UPI0036CC1BDD